MSITVSWVDGGRRGPLAGTTVSSGTRDACLDTLAPFLVVGPGHACWVVVHEGLLGAVGWILAGRVVT